MSNQQPSLPNISNPDRRGKRPLGKGRSSTKTKRNSGAGKRRSGKRKFGPRKSGQAKERCKIKVKRIKKSTSSFGSALGSDIESSKFESSVSNQSSKGGRGSIKSRNSKRSSRHRSGPGNDDNVHLSLPYEGSSVASSGLGSTSSGSSAVSSTGGSKGGKGCSEASGPGSASWSDHMSFNTVTNTPSSPSSLIGDSPSEENSSLEVAKSAPSVALDVTKTETIETTTKWFLDKRKGKMRYCVKEQVNVQMDGHVNANLDDSTNLLKRIREDAVAKDFIPDLGTLAKEGPKKTSHNEKPKSEAKKEVDAQLRSSGRSMSPCKMFPVSRRSSNGPDECSIGETSTPGKLSNWRIPTSPRLMPGKSKTVQMRVNNGTLENASLPEVIPARDSYSESETFDQKMMRLHLQLAGYVKEEKELSAKLGAFFGQISHFNGHSLAVNKHVDTLVEDNKSLFVATLKKALVEKEIQQLTVTRALGCSQVAVSQEPGPGRLVIRSLSFPLRYPVRNCALFCLLRHKSQVVTSPVVRQSTGDTLTFAVNHTFEGLQTDFQVLVELYLMPLDPSLWATERAAEGLWARIIRNFACCSRRVGDEPKELMIVKEEVDSPLVHSSFGCLGTVTIDRAHAAEKRRTLVNLVVSNAPCTGTVLLDHELTVDYELGLAGDNVFLGHLETRPCANASVPFRLKLFKCALFLNKNFLTIRRKKSTSSLRSFLTFGGTVENNLDLARCINDDSAQASLSTSSKYTHLALIFKDDGEFLQYFFAVSCDSGRLGAFHRLLKDRIQLIRQWKPSSQLDPDAELYRKLTGNLSVESIKRDSWL